MHRYELAFASEAAGALGVEPEEILKLIRIPEADRGDFSLPCFPFAKAQKKAPPQIAADTAQKLSDSALFSVSAAGPYVNATLNPAVVIATLIPEIRQLADRFATSDEGEGQTVVIDYSSPNIAKPLGFHHLRSTMIGNALVRLFRARGYCVEGINFLGDWGKTFGLLAAIYQRIGDRDRLEKEGIAYLLGLYIEANKEKERDPGFDDAARALFKQMEDGDPSAMELWKLFRDISLAEFKRVYARLNVSFEHFEGESFYRDGMDDLIEQISATAGTRVDQGALVVDMPYEDGEPPMMLKKSDGATLYATRDIAAAKDRWRRFSFARSIYVVGGEQKRHFEQLKRALAAMGDTWQERMVHVNFGRVHGMSTRKGNVVFLEEVLDEASERAREKMATDSSDRDIDLDRVAEEVGIGGIVFGDLKNLRTSDYNFDWEDILNTKGFSGICVQYAHARCSSILRKAGGTPNENDTDLRLLTAPEEITLVKEIGRIPQAVAAAAAELEPSRLARALYEAARAWNRYQQAGNADKSLRILTEDTPLRNARLALVDATRIALKKGLDLLGVSAPDAM
jgi:arginyl-tRNA synthetase